MKDKLKVAVIGFFSFFLAVACYHAYLDHMVFHQLLNQIAAAQKQTTIQK